MPFDNSTAMILLAASMVIRRHEWPVILGVIASDRPWRNRDFTALGVDKADVSRAIARLLRDRVLTRADGRLQFNPQIEEWEGGRALVKHQLETMQTLVGETPTSPAQGADLTEKPVSSSNTDASGSSSASRSRRKDDAAGGKKPTSPAKGRKKAGVGKTPTGRKLPERAVEYARWLKEQIKARGGIVKRDFHLVGIWDIEYLFQDGATREELERCAVDLLDDGRTIVDSLCTIARLYAPWRMHIKSGRGWPRGKSRRPAIVGGDSGGRAAINPVTRGPKAGAPEMP